MAKRAPRYPWALLYNLESQIERPAMPSERGVGRPRNPIPRSRVTLLMTADEVRTLQHLTHQMQDHLHPAKISRSQVVGIALRLLKIKLDKIKLPETVVDWPTLIAVLNEEGS